MKKTLRKVFSLALALMCCIATVSPISAKAEYITEKSADFSAATDDALFSTTYGGWSSADGVYKANMAWANAYLTEPISLATNKVISFDFCLQNDQDTDHQFNVGLVGVSGSTISGGVTAHFYYSSQWSTEMATLNSEFGSATGGTWYADTTTNYFDGQKHTMTVMISDNTASFQIDGNDVFTSVSVGLEQAHLIFQATSTEYYVDNIKIETEVPEYENLEVDFAEITDGDVFATTYGGWSVVDGAYVANTAWANTYLNGLIPLDENKIISFDFCLADDNDADHQFNVGLVNVSGATISGGVSAHFYYSSQWSIEMATLNSEFGSTTGGTWYADTTTDYFDGQTHTMTITVTDKTASYQIDGNDVFTSAAVGLDNVYLVFQATSTAYTIDNLKIENVVQQEPQEPAIPEYSEQDIDFDVEEDASVFATTYEGFAVADGVYKANTAWANAYLNCEIPLDEDKEISFDFCLNNNGDINHQFNIGLIDIENNTLGAGVAGHFYCHSTYGELFTLNRDFSNPIGNGWIADNTDGYNDGNVHTMHIQVKDGNASFYIDNKEIFKDVVLDMDVAYFIMQFTSVDSYIDNFKVSDTLSVISSGSGEIPDSGETPDPGETPNPPETDDDKKEYREVQIDFDAEEDTDVFASTYGGWSALDGVYKANTAWANTYLDFEIPLNEKKQISFDFCLKNNGDKNHQFNFGFIDIDGTTLGEGLAAHFYNNTKYGELFTLNKDFGNPIGQGWIADNTDNYNDGKSHTMIICVEDQKASFYIDGKPIFSHIPLEASTAYFIMQFTSTESYIDNLKVSNTLTVNPDKDFANVSTPSGGQGGQTSGGMTSVGVTTQPYSEVKVDFSDKKDADVFATTYEGWSVVDGVYKANAAWANTYLNCEIPLNEDKEIAFDFCLKNNGDKNHQFNIGFVDIDGTTISKGLAAHFYQHAQYGELFTLNKDFGNPIGEGWIADHIANFNDGEVHSMLIRIQDGKVAFYIDGENVFTDIALGMSKAYFIMQFTSTESYVDNFRVSDTLTYIPDYPTNTPDATGDEAAKADSDDDALKPTKGEVEQKELQKEGLSPIATVLVITGASVLIIALAIGGAILFKRKRQGKTNE